jgi:hypothetical protein
MSDNTFNKANRSFEVDYDQAPERLILRVLDSEGLYPFWLYDPEAGYYQIRKTRRGGLQMTK